MAEKKPANGDAGPAEAKRILKRLESETETFGHSAMVRASDGLKSSLKGDADPGDRIEVLGTRIGRAMGLVAFAALAAFLVFTYVWPIA